MQETVAVAVHPHGGVAADGGAFGIAQPRIGCESGRLAIARQRHGLLRRQVPRVVEIEVRHLARQAFRIGETRILVSGSMARDGGRLAHDLAHRIGPQIRRAGRALGLAEIHRERQAAVTMIFDGIHLSETHRRGEPALQAGIGLGMARTTGACLAQRAGDHVLKLADACGIDLLRHALS